MVVPVLVAVLTARAVQQSAALPTHDTSVKTFPARVLRDAERLADKRPLVVIAVGGAMAALVHPVDASVVNSFKPEGAPEEALDPGSVAGDIEEQGSLALGVYAIGRLTHHDGAAELGTELLEAQAINGVLTQSVKFAVDRRRPNGGHHSFPSGHASATFATADVFAQRFGWKIGALAYAGGVYVALSRLGEHAHYPSDTLFGAALGIASARSVVAARHRPVLKGFAVVPVVTKGGAAVLVTR
ncbi:MAG TPA: phosphatase PAP2 family protein [Vicinamibacterales bacterium]|jgi:membrane-associated phospholipid phosphatase